jgi:hypothetical protein
VIKMARRMHINSCLVTYFALGAQACLASFAAMSAVLQLPTVVTGIPILWVSWVCIPLLALPLLASEPDEEIMHQISPKNDASESNNILCGGTATVKRVTAYFFVRFFPSSVVCTLIYLWSLADISHQPLVEVLNPKVATFPGWGVTSELDFTHMGVLACPRAASLFFFVAYLALHAASFVHRAEGWCQESICHRNQTWCGFAVGVIVLQIIYTVAALSAHDRLGDLSELTWPVWALGFGWPVFLYILDNLVAKRDDGERGYGRKTDLFGRELWLDFNTKLGMHSPV